MKYGSSKRNPTPRGPRSVAEVADSAGSAPIPAMLCACAAGALATAVVAKLLHGMMPKKPRVVRQSL